MNRCGNGTGPKSAGGFLLFLMLSLGAASAHHRRATTYDDTNPAIVYSQGQNGDGVNGWGTCSDSGDFGGGEHYSNAYSGSFVVHFAGTDFQWIGKKGPNFGIASVFMDGQSAGTVDAYNATELHQQVLYSTSGLANGSHVFQMKIGDYPSPAKNPSSSNWYQVLDAFTTSGTPLQLPMVSPQDSAVTKGGAWSFGPNILSGSYGWSNDRSTPGSLTFPFSGTGVEVYGHPEGEDGMMDVYIDGAYVTTVDEFNPYLDVYSSDSNDDSLLYVKTGLPAGNHTIKLVVAQTKNPGASDYYSQIDGFIALPSVGTAPAAPSGLAASAVSSSQINLAWTDNSTNESGFNIYRATASGGPYTQVGSVGPDVTSFSSTGLAGSTTYYYRVRSADSFGESTDSNTASATTFSGGGSGGSLSGSSGSSSGFNLTSAGTSDWIHWGRGGVYGNLDRKASGGGQISNVTLVGSGGNYGGWSDSSRSASWTDGTPTGSATNDHGYIWSNGALNSGFQFTAPADPSTRTVIVYFGASTATCTLSAHLSDGSAADYTTSFTGPGAWSATITYHAASAGQSLVLKLLKTGNNPGYTDGSADLDAAMLE